MVSKRDIFFNRAFFYGLQILDRIMNIFGYKLFAVNSQNILSGLTDEQKKEAALSYNANLIQDLELGFKNDNRVPVKDRYFMCHIVKHWIRMCVKVKRALKEFPGAAQTPVINPIIIVGPSRTGTTFLHHLMAQDPHLFAPMYWELLAPTPPGRPKNWRQCARYLLTKKAVDIRQALVYDKTEQIHRLSVDNPEECTAVLGVVLQQIWCFTRMDTMDHLAERYYSRTHEDMVAMYRNYKSILQLIAYKGMADKRFLLKCPLHLSHLDALLEVFPGACLIFTHRSVSSTLASRCSLIHNLTYGWGPPDNNYGQKLLKLSSYLTNRGFMTMKKYENKDQNDNPFINIDYTTLVKTPIETIRKIYERFDMNFFPDVEESFKKWLDMNPQNKHGKHRYSMADYGISQQDVRDNFQPYIDHMSQYGIAVL